MKDLHGSREVKVFFDPFQEELYRLQVKYGRRIPGCIYPLWYSLKGRGRFGEFPLVVVREYFLKRGYKVLYSDSSQENPHSFICASYPGLRRQRPVHSAYRQMIKIFGFGRLEAFNRKAEAAKLRLIKGRNRGGGDPDLFVYRANGKRVRFFVEVKHEDSLLENQKIVFPLMRMYLCPVRVVRIYPKRMK